MDAIKCVVIGLFLTASQANACPRHSAPGNFHNPAKAWQGSDTGVVVNGFVDFKNTDSALYKLEHGIDLSSNNEVDYKRLSECGAAFAFVRMDRQHASHVERLRLNTVKTYPYVFFPIPKKLRKRSLYTAPRDETVATLYADFSQIGLTAARNFLMSPNAVRTIGDAPASMANLDGDIIALDIEEKLLDESASTHLERALYGRLYARAVCSWIGAVRQARPEVIVLLYTTPSIYSDYLDKALPQDHACLQGLPIWVARTTVDGGDVIRSSDSTIDRYAQRLCLVSGGNRCINHQYSHRGIFGAKGVTSDGTPAHVDLNRFFYTKTIQNAVGLQFVRTNETR